MRETTTASADVTGLALGLYEALLDGRGLAPALRGLAGRIGASAHAVHLIRYRDGRPVSGVSAGQGGLEGEALAEYARYWVKHDPWARAGSRLPVGVHDIASIVPPERLRESHFWKAWGRAREAAFHCLAVPLRREGDQAGGAYFHRREGEPPFGERERGVLEAVLPHLRRVFAAEAQLAAVRETPAAALRAGLDALAEGVALFDTERRFAFANAALARMAAEGDGMALSAAGIEVPDPGTRLALGRALTAALAAAQGQLGLLPAAGSLALPRPSGKAPWLVRAVPVLRGAPEEVPGSFRGAMLLVSDGERRVRPPAALLGRLFGLTPAEAALAAAVAGGQTLADHARRRGIAVETVRSHLAALRRKTGCRRQADLAALFARLPG